MSVIFYPSSINFVKKSAKQLQRAFPALQLATAQEATASALGFSSWFDCSTQIENARNTSSLPDEDISSAERLKRRYQQIRALVDIANLPTCEVDYFIRHWNLTAQAPATKLTGFCTDFDVSDADLVAWETGEISKEELEQRYEFSFSGNYPRRIAEGIILGPCGPKHEYYQLSSKRLLEMPLYLRGNASVFLEFETGKLVALAFPHYFIEKEQQAGLVYLKENEPWLYEWCTGNTPHGFDGPSLRQLSHLAVSVPEEWFALSIRFRPDTVSKKFQYVVPALRGADFARFIEAKGHLRGLDLQWFALKDNATLLQLNDFGNGFNLGRATSNQLNRDAITPTEPLFGSPFKFGPMSIEEFSTTVEGGGMLLTEEMTNGSYVN